MNFEEVGRRIKNRRMELKLTQEKLAEQTGLSETYIGAIERSTSKCSIETLVKIATALNIDMDFLLFGTTIGNIDNHFFKIMNNLPKDKQKLYIELCDAIAEKLR